MSEYSRLMCVYGTVFMVMSGVLPASQIIIIQTKNLRVEYGTDLKRKEKNTSSGNPGPETITRLRSIILDFFSFYEYGNRYDTVLTHSCSGGFIKIVRKDQQRLYHNSSRGEGADSQNNKHWTGGHKQTFGVGTEYRILSHQWQGILSQELVISHV